MIICYCFEKFSFLISKLRNIVKEKKRKKRSQLPLFFLSLSFCRCSRASGSKVPSVPFENKNIFFFISYSKAQILWKKYELKKSFYFVWKNLKLRFRDGFLFVCIVLLFCFVFFCCCFSLLSWILLLLKFYLFFIIFFLYFFLHFD